MAKETMTPRERWLAVLTRQRPDRVPIDYWATTEASAKLIRHLGLSHQSERRIIADLDRGDRELLEEALNLLHIDFVVHATPRYEGPKLPEHTDVFGCRYQDVDYGTGIYSECVYHPLATYRSVDEIERNYIWPDPDFWVYDDIAQQVRGYETHPIRGGGSEPFLIYKNLRGQEQALMDLVLNPEIVHYCLDKLFDLAYENTVRIFEQIPGQVMLTYVAEDMGGQDDLMISPAHIREFLVPRMKRMIDLSHEAGAFVFHHNDGNCRRIIPDMIEAGIDILNPIQWRSNNMDRESLNRDFGDQVVFHGAVDNQYTLPFGTIDEVRQEVMDNLRVLGDGGGYILAPCHNIQAVGPAENVVAMYHACLEYGWY
ncbi:MAG: uroporphyrinogen-III decarboxylase-like protein [Chloroflexi bacterium]|nr:uroporphyrinogen-III decarboxylase-like protein [Chloroflexota bacterium]